MNCKEMLNQLEKKYGASWEYLKDNCSVKNEISFAEYCDSKGLEDYHYEYVMEKIEELAGIILTPATVKVGDGVTVCLWSDRHAATVIKVTKCSVTVRRDKATLDPSFKPEWIAGGFAGHCTNQEEQTYTYEEDPNGEEYTFKWSKKYGSYGTPGNIRLINGRHEFYDYNF